MHHRIVANGLDLILRPCSFTDQGFIYELMRNHMEDMFNRNTPEDWSRAKFRQGFNPDRIVILEHEGMSIGFLDYEKRRDELYLHCIQLSGDYQTGIGNSLLLWIEQEARKQGAKAIIGKVFLDNERIIKWLNPLGFNIFSEIPEENSYWIRKELK